MSLVAGVSVATRSGSTVGTKGAGPQASIAGGGSVVEVVVASGTAAKVGLNSVSAVPDEEQAASKTAPTMSRFTMWRELDVA